MPSITPNSFKNKNFLAFGVVAALIIIVVLVGGAFFLWQQNEMAGGLSGTDTNATLEYTQVLVSGNAVTTDFMPIEGVEVTVSDLNVITDEYGHYSFALDAADQQIISFSKKGFVPTHKLLDTPYNGVFAVDALMFEEEAFQKVDDSKDINVEMSGAGLATGPDSFIVKSDGAKPSSVNISITPFDPTDEIQIKAFPGEFSGTRLDGTTTGLETFGFAKLQVKDDEGNKLDLAPGKTADLKIPIADSEKDSSPDTIPLWYFDENQGTWIERGAATKICTDSECYYEGKIDTVASYWNCDQAEETSKFKCGGEPEEGEEGGGDGEGSEASPASSREIVRILFAKYYRGQSMSQMNSTLGRNMANTAGTFFTQKFLKSLPGGVGVAADVGFLMNQMVNDYKGSKDAAGRAAAIGKTLAVWAAGKAASAAGVKGVYEGAKFASALLSNLKDYLAAIMNNFPPKQCVAEGSDYKGKSSAPFFGGGSRSGDHTITDPTGRGGTTSSSGSSDNQKPLPVKSNSKVNLHVEGIDLISESFEVDTPPSGETSSVSYPDYSAVSIPVDFQPSDGRGMSSVNISFINEEGKETQLNKILSPEMPFGYFTIMILSGRSGKIVITDPVNNYVKEYAISPLDPAQVLLLEEQDINSVWDSSAIPDDLNATDLGVCPSNASSYKKNIDQNFVCGCGPVADKGNAFVYGDGLYTADSR
ncbi:MAG: hypothetical protein AABW59_05485, partial [archaeon]